jgi:hypothetical protein
MSCISPIFSFFENGGEKQKKRPPHGERLVILEKISETLA